MFELDAELHELVNRYDDLGDEIMEKARDRMHKFCRLYNLVYTCGLHDGFRNADSGFIVSNNETIDIHHMFTWLCEQTGAYMDTNDVCDKNGWRKLTDDDFEEE